MTKWTTYTLAALAALVALALFSAGCGGAKFRKVNVAAGEYYSEDEYEVLPDSEKGRYCSALEGELGRTQQEFDAKTKQIADTKNLIESIRKQIIPLEKEVIDLEAEIRTLKDRIREVESLPKNYKVKPGDTLTLISMQPKIYNDIDKWWKIFEANQDKIEDPYYIFPDTVLVIPRDWPTD